QSLWTAPVFRLIGTPPLPMWMVWAGVASVVVGLFFFITAVRPGRMTHVPVSPSVEGAAATMWIRNVDISRLVSGTTRRLPGVSTAQTRTTGNTKKGLKVEITSAGDVDDPMLAQRVTDSVKHSLQHLGTKVEVSVEVEKKQELGTDVQGITRTRPNYLHSPGSSAHRFGRLANSYVFQRGIRCRTSTMGT